MKHIYIEVSEDDYSDAKEIGFFEVTDFIRTELRSFIRAQKDHRNGTGKTDRK